MTIKSPYPNLPHAPIEEAIISLTIGKQKHASLHEVVELCENLKHSYPVRKNWKINEFTFEEIDIGSTMSPREKLTGFVISSENQKMHLHLSQDTLSLNRLKPYGSWAEFAKDYKAAWDIFTEKLNIEVISEISIRYINNFSIPVAGWEGHLHMRPNLQSSSEFDESTISLGEVFSRYVLFSERHMAQSVVNLNLKAETNESLRVIMDIEVGSRMPIFNYSGFHEVKDVLNRLRDFKNQIFFANVPRAEELFA